MRFELFPALSSRMMEAEGGRQRKRARTSAPEAAPARWCVAVHVGAGYHKPAREQQWRATLSAACAAAAAVLAQPQQQPSASWAAHNDFVPIALRAVTAALASLEDDERTNAGLGSNLTEGGYVEADARCGMLNSRVRPFNSGLTH
jgi:isoaspartyl peptidase/L-asparaginase-like protein (Ntn-hydrolase superfamily)